MAKVDTQIAKLEQQLEALHTQRLHMTTALSWAGGADVDTERSAREQAEAALRQEQEEAERNRLAQEHAAQAAEIAREHTAEEQERIQRAEAEALTRRQGALHG